MTHAREAVLDAIVTALQRIGTSAIPNGISAWMTSSAPNVLRRRVIPRNLASFPVALVVPQGQENERTGTGGATTVWERTLSVQIDYWIRVMRDFEPDQELSDALHDVEATLSDDHTIGGAAIDSEVIGDRPSEAEAENPLYGITIDFQVIYRTKFRDPSSTV